MRTSYVSRTIIRDANTALLAGYGPTSFSIMRVLAAVLLLLQGLAKLAEDIVIACGHAPITHADNDDSHQDDRQNEGSH